MGFRDFFKSGKKIKIFGKEYSKSEWEEALKSNKGIFKRAKKIPTTLAGPSLTKSYDLIGEGFTMESMTLGNCTQDQQTAYRNILNKNEEKALEYLFTITNSDVIWKKKIKFLQDFMINLKAEEDYLLGEESVLKKAEKMKAHLVNPELEKHFPYDFKVLRKDIHDLEKFSNDLEMAVAHIESVKKKIESHLAHLKNEVPFLF